MRHQDLFVHERFGASMKSAFEGATIIVGIRRGEMLLRDVTSEGCCRGKAGGTVAPGASREAPDAMC